MLDFHNLTCPLSAFEVLGMRPISFLGNEELSNLGNDKIDILVSQYEQAKVMKGSVRVVSQATKL